MPIRFETLWNTPGAPGKAPGRAVYEQAVQRSTWPLRMAVSAAVLVAVLPLLIVVAAALLAGAVVYAVCSVAARIAAVFSGSASSGPSQTANNDPLRDNVRVIPRA